MTATRHAGSVHIDSPVERVFDHVKDPAHFYEAMPARMRPTPGSVGPVHVTPEGIGTWTVEPEGEGTRLSLTFEYSSKVPLMDKVIDAIGWRGDSDLEAMLARVKEKVET